MQEQQDLSKFHVLNPIRNGERCWIQCISSGNVMIIFVESAQTNYSKRQFCLSADLINQMQMSSMKI